MLHKCLSAFCSPLFSVPLVISPLAFLPFLRSSCCYLFCPFSYGVFSFSTSSFGGFGLLHSPAYSSPSAWYLRSPFLRCLDWVGGCICGVLHRYCLRLLLVFLLSPLPRHFCLCLILRVLLPLFLLSSLRVLSPDSSLLPSSSLTWPVSSAPGWGSPPLVSVVPCYLRCSAWRSVIVCCLCLLCFYWLLCGSLWLCLFAV